MLSTVLACRARGAAIKTKLQRRRFHVGWRRARLRRITEAFLAAASRSGDAPAAKRRRLTALAEAVEVLPAKAEARAEPMQTEVAKPAPAAKAEPKPLEVAKPVPAAKAESKPLTYYETSRDEKPLKLVGEMAPARCLWQYPLKSEEWRCFAGYLPGAIPKSQAATFFAMIKDGTKWLQPSGKWGPLPLKTAWMSQAPCSCKYRYGGAEVTPDPYPEWMMEILAFCMPLCGLPDRASWPNSCNLNLYVDGTHSVGWHADNESLFQGKVGDCRILSLSLGQARQFELKTKGDMHKLTLSDGDLCTMEGLCQKHYLHRVPKENQKGLCNRINLTWRWVVEHGKECELSSNNPSKNIPASSASTNKGQTRSAK